MAGFLDAHGYAPGPTQRPLLTGAISGALATIPAVGLLLAFGSLGVEARILGISDVATVAIGVPAMAVAGAVYARVFGRAANNARGGWLFGLAYGFVLWAGGAVMVLPIVSGGVAPAGQAAVGVLLSLFAWGAALGALLPFVQRPLHQRLQEGAKLHEVGPSAAASKKKGGRLSAERRS